MCYKKQIENKGMQNSIKAVLDSAWINICTSSLPFGFDWSRNNLIFYGHTSYYEDKAQELFICPLFNEHRLEDINSSSSQMEKFFFHSNDDYIVTMIQKNNSFTFQITDINFKVIQEIVIERKKELNPISQIILSPSGRYLFFAEEICVDENGNENDNDNGYYRQHTKLIIRIFEFKHDQLNNKFYLELKHEFTDLCQKLDLSLYSFSSYGDLISFLTDSMDLIFVFKYNSKIYFNGQDWSHLIENKLGKSEYNQNAYKTLYEYSISVTNAGISISNNEYVYQLRIDHKNNKILPLIKINFDFNKWNIYVTSIYGCRDPNLIIINLAINSKWMLLTWDVDLNQEFNNFSWSYINGIILWKNWKSAIAIIENHYVNLDKGVTNYFFDWNLEYSLYDRKKGYLMNTMQNLLIRQNVWFCKETIVGISNCYSLLDNMEDALKDK